MSRILLADDSPHAQRMGERILREEGFEVVSLTDGETVILRLPDVDPDVIVADVFLPGKSGLDLCRHVKGQKRYPHTRIVLTAGLLEPFDEEEARKAGCDAIIKKPFEASAMLAALRPLIQNAQEARGIFADVIASAAAQAPPPAARTPVPPTPPDPERVRAAVTLALDAALPALIDEITERVLIALDNTPESAS
ncbi:MAG TPA: response regulator [Bryobacteraceae bacterium]|jgi:CheY-like chemotaxis protein|nr:response regulator [Bryobacteraceae bacterium]